MYQIKAILEHCLVFQVFESSPVASQSALDGSENRKLDSTRPSKMTWGHIKMSVSGSVEWSPHVSTSLLKNLLCLLFWSTLCIEMLSFSKFIWGRKKSIRIISKQELIVLHVKVSKNTRKLSHFPDRSVTTQLRPPECNSPEKLRAFFCFQFTLVCSTKLLYNC